MNFKEDKNRKIEEAIYEELTKPFPIQAYKVDKSRGFELTSLDAQYIKDRLNGVLGIGGWDFQERFEVIDSSIEIEEMDRVAGKPIMKTIHRKGVICQGILTIFIPQYDDEGIRMKDKAIFKRATGGCSYKSKGQTISDVWKSAATESLSKCCSYLGIGGEMYKGLIDPKVIAKEKGNYEAAIKAVKSAKTDSEKKRLQVMVDQYKWDIGEKEELLKMLKGEA